VVNTKGVNTVNLYESIRTFDGLYYKALWKRILGRLRHHRHRLLPLAPWWEVTGTGEATYRGIKAVPIAQIVGTENRFSDFDREFLPLKRRDRHRWARIHALYEEGKPLPPVSLVKIGDFYFVRDGHHRISAARASGALYIDAEVVEISIPQDAPQDSPERFSTTLKNGHFGKRQVFPPYGSPFLEGTWSSSASFSVSSTLPAPMLRKREPKGPLSLLGRGRFRMVRALLSGGGEGH
jgi:hypothetical protein